jgi:hypothetical protein
MAVKIANAPGNQEFMGAKFSKKQIGATTTNPYSRKKSNNEADICSGLAMAPVVLATV